MRSNKVMRERILLMRLEEFLWLTLSSASPNLSAFVLFSGLSLRVDYMASPSVSPFFVCLLRNKLLILINIYCRLSVKENVGNKQQFQFAVEIPMCVAPAPFHKNRIRH